MEWRRFVTYLWDDPRKLGTFHLEFCTVQRGMHSPGTWGPGGSVFIKELHGYMKELGFNLPTPTVTVLLLHNDFGLVVHTRHV